MVMEGIEEDIGDGINMQCTNHPYKNSSPGGICAFCLQEKLGKLVSSSFTSAVFPASSSSSSSTPSFRSDLLVTSNTTTTGSSALPLQTMNQTSDCNNNNYDAIRKSIMPFMLSTQKKDGPNSASGSGNNIAFKRSKSTATPRNRLHFMDSEDYSPQKKGFWSYVYYSSSSNKHSSNAKKGQPVRNVTFPSSTVGSSGTMRPRDKKKEEIVVVEENESPDAATFDRKVSRSRSVGCGSRSFSGEFFERITGFGDCTLRRVESQREGKTSNKGQDCNIKERVKCGGIFSGFMITSSSSSSSSSSYWVSSEENVNGIKSITGQGRTNNNKSWGWAFASPMRAFSKPSSSNGKRKASSNKNVTPNLSAIPSLLTVRS